MPDDDVEFDVTEDPAPVVVPSVQPEQVPDAEVDEVGPQADDEGMGGL